MNKLLEALLADGRAVAIDWASAIAIEPGEIVLYREVGKGPTARLYGVGYNGLRYSSVTRAEFDAALKQYPSSTQGEIVQPEPNHEFLERICLAANLVVDDMTIDDVCEALKAEDKTHSDFTDTAIAGHELLTRLYDVLGVPEGVDPVQHAETLKHNNEQLIRATNILHDGQLYRNATVLLHTDQLIVWRDADNQEQSAPSHQVTLNPDDNGLAAAILSRIGSYEVAPEHIAEMRQQMGWLE